MSSSNQHHESTALAPCTTDLPCPISNLQEPAFVCTICWQDQPQGSKPKLLGTSARIVCHACWCAVLDLSICWVCGECIVRGDEVISLGWCFWHRSCFGCLFCKTTMSLPTSGNLDKRTDVRGHRGFDGSEDGTSARTDKEDTVRRCAGVELEDVPLCGVCKVETAGEEPNLVLEKGLETVTKCDGGLSRDRMHMLDERSSNRPAEVTNNGRLNRLAPRRIKGSRAHEIESDLRRYINDGSTDHMDTNFEISMTDGANSPKKPQSEDGSTLPQSPSVVSQTEVACSDPQEIYSHSDSEIPNSQSNHPEQMRNNQKDIYVSIFNPLEEPAFRPSKTKPLPQWMRLLPNNVHRQRGTEHIHRTRSLDSFRSLRELQVSAPTTPVAVDVFSNTFEDSDHSTQYHTAATSPATKSIHTTISTEIAYFAPPEVKPVITPSPNEAPRRLTFASVFKSTTDSEDTDDSSDDSESEVQSSRKSRASLPSAARPSILRRHAHSPAPASGAIHPSLDVLAHGFVAKSEAQKATSTALPRMSRARTAYQKSSPIPDVPKFVGSGAIHPSLETVGARSKVEHSLPLHRPKTSLSHKSRSKSLQNRATSPPKSPAIVPETLHPTQDIFALLMPPTPPISPQKMDDLLRQQAERLRLPESSTSSRSQSSGTSREYLERYQPIVTGQTNFEKYVPKDREPILEKIKRQRLARVQEEGECKVYTVEEDSKGKRKSVARAGPGDPRGDLHQELSRLFKCD